VCKNHPVSNPEAAKSCNLAGGNRNSGFTCNLFTNNSKTGVAVLCEPVKKRVFEKEKQFSEKIEKFVLNKDKKVLFVDPQDINHRSKAANKQALEYFLKRKQPELDYNFLKKLYSEKYGIKSDLIPDDWVNQLDFDVFNQFEKYRTSMRNKGLLFFAENKFSSYLKRIQENNRYLIIENNQTGKSAKKKLDTRYSKSYKKKVEKRMDWLMYKYSTSNGVFLTLTIDPKKYDYDKVRMWNDLGNQVNRFLTSLKNDLDKIPSYLWTVEVHKGRKENNFLTKGQPHVHIVFFGCTRLMDWKVLRKKWGLGHIYVNRTHKGEKVRFPVSYITKYITKTFTKNSSKNLTAQAMLWLFNKRSFSCSRALGVAPLKPKGSGEWSLVELAFISDTGDQFLEFEIIDFYRNNLFDFSVFKSGGIPPPIGGKKYGK